MLSDAGIESVVLGVRDCYRQLAVVGTGVILDREPTASPASAPSASDELREGSSPPPALVLLHWGATGPETCCDKPLIDLMHLDLQFNPEQKFNPSVPSFCHVRNSDSEMAEKAGGGSQFPPVVDLVIWHLNNRTLELQADTNFTELTVTNALAREIALNAAKSMLPEYLGLGCGETQLGDSDSPRRDPEVVDFTARLKDSVESITAEARSAGQAYSVSPPPFSDKMEDVLRAYIARRRREESDRKEQRRSLLAKKAAHAVAVTAAAASGGTPPPPLKEDWSYNTAPISASELAASPTLVLRPFEDIYRGFSDIEIMSVFKKVVLSRSDCVLCPGYEVWFEKKEGGRDHDYEMESGPPYC